jgi:predicted hydrocarbon binding protein
MGRVYLLALDEILGVDEARHLLDSAGRSDLSELPFSVIHKIHQLLAEQYGAPAGRGVAQRLGRAAFKYLLGSFGSELGLDALEFRLLPLRRRIDLGLDHMIQLFQQETDQTNRLESDPESHLWQIENSPFCLPSQQPPGPACDWMVGLLQEALSWMGGGKYYQVREEKCIASGASLCTIKIDRIPIG